MWGRELVQIWFFVIPQDSLLRFLLLHVLLQQLEHARVKVEEEHRVVLVSEVLLLVFVMKQDNQHVFVHPQEKVRKVHAEELVAQVLLEELPVLQVQDEEQDEVEHMVLFVVQVVVFR